MRWLIWMLMVVLPAGPTVRADEPAPDTEATAAGTQAVEADDEADLRDDSRLLLSPTGRPLRQGTGYLLDQEILLPGFSVGLTDNVSLSAGMSVVPGVGDDGQVFYVSPRIGKRFSKRLAVSGGFFYARIPTYFADVRDAKELRLGYAVATLGGAASSLTAGVYAGSGTAAFAPGSASRPSVMLGGAIRLAPGFVVVSENWFWSVPYGEFGLRATSFLALRLSKGRFSTDLGFMRSGRTLYPWLSVSYHLGRVRRADGRD